MSFATLEREAGRGRGVWPWIAPALLVHAGLCAAHLWFLDRSPLLRHLTLDLASYDEWARRILQGDLLGRGVFYQDPLYSYLVAAIYWLSGAEIMHVLVAQALGNILVLLLIYLLAEAVYSPRAARLAVWMGALYGPAIYYAGKPEKAAFAALFLTTAAWMFLHGRRRPGLWLLGSGAALGLASLLRANALLIAFLGIAAILATPLVAPKFPRQARIEAWWSRRMKAAAWLAGGVALVLLPVLARNRVVGEDWVFTTSQAGANLFVGNNPGNLTGTYVVPAFIRPAPRFEEGDFRRFAERSAGRKLLPSEVSRFYVRTVLQWAWRDPGKFLRLQGKKALAFLDAFEYPDNWSLYFVSEFSPVLRLPLLSWAAILPFGLLGCGLAFRRPRELDPLWLACLAAAYALSIVAFYVFSRYRYPIVPCLLVLAAGACTHLVALARGRQWRPLGICAVALVAGYALVFFGRPGDHSGDLSQRYSNLAAEYFAEHDGEEARRLCERALEVNPSNHLAHFTLSRLAFQRGDGAAEKSHLELAYEARPEDLEVRTAMLWMNARTGGYAAAARLGDAWLAASPPGSSYRLLRILADIALTEGLFDAARERLRSLLREYPEDAWAIGKLDELSDPETRLLGEVQSFALAGQHDRALALLVAEIAARPRPAIYYQFLANLQYLRGDRKAARAALAEALAREPENELYRRNLAALDRP